MQRDIFNGRAHDGYIYLCRREEPAHGKPDGDTYIIFALVSMLIQAEKYGTSVSDALLIFSEDLRNKRRLRAQELAAKIPVKLSMPIILFIFPAIFIVLLGPPMMSIMRMFH